MLQDATRRWALEHGRYPAAVAEVWPLCVGKTALLEVGCSLDAPPFEGTERAALALRLHAGGTASDLFLLVQEEEDPPGVVAPGAVQWVVRGDPDHPEARALRDAVREWLAKPLPKIGRPKGTGTFRDGQDFLETMRQVYAELKKQGRAFTEEAVSDFLRVRGVAGRGALLAGVSDPERQLRRWCREVGGFASWEAMRQELMRES
jgi:hypothetical protein